MDATSYDFDADHRDPDLKDSGSEAETTPVFRKATKRAGRLNLLAQANGNALPLPRSPRR